jgi:hypothetical protein
MVKGYREIEKYLTYHLIRKEEDIEGIKLMIS